MPHKMLFLDFLKLSRVQRIAFIANVSPNMLPCLKRGAINARGL